MSTAAIDASKPAGRAYEPKKPGESAPHDRHHVRHRGAHRLERRRQRMREILERALAKDQVLTVPADVIAEWWRGRTDLRESILESVDIEPLTEPVAKLAGEALAAVKGATLVDRRRHGFCRIARRHRLFERRERSREAEPSLPRGASAARLAPVHPSEITALERGLARGWRALRWRKASGGNRRSRRTKVPSLRARSRSRR